MRCGSGRWPTRRTEEWAKATSYYQRYLMMVPDDLEARVDMVQAYAQSAQDSRGKRRLTTLLYHTLGFAPMRDDLRMQLAENLLQTGDYAAAEVEANKLLESPEHKTDAWRVLAISRYARARADGPISIEDAAKTLLAALADQPGNVRLAAITAQVLRANPKLEALQGADAADRADQIIAQMVAANRDDAAALLARYRYRKQYAQSAETQPGRQRPRAGAEAGTRQRRGPALGRSGGAGQSGLNRSQARPVRLPQRRAPKAPLGPSSFSSTWSRWLLPIRAVTWRWRRCFPRPASPIGRSKFYKVAAGLSSEKTLICSSPSVRCCWRAASWMKWPQ